jgi:hypothetical protein
MADALRRSEEHGQRGVSDPSVAAGEIADAVKSGGRSRPDIDFGGFEEGYS